MVSLYYYAALAGTLATMLAAIFSASAVAALAQSGRSARISSTTFGASVLALAVAAAALGLSVVGRTVAAKAPPMSDMWGYVVTLGLGMTTFATLFAWRHREPALVLLVSLTVSAGLIASEIFFDSGVRPLIPALQANRLLTAHVTTMMVAYSFIAVAFAAAAAHLLKSRWPSLAGLPSAQRSQRIANEAAMLALPTLTLGIALGAYWANSAWGRYWGWDPKETAAALTWFLLVEYFHMQSLRRWRGTRSSWVLVLGFASVVFNMVAINFWVSGLHSYA